MSTQGYEIERPRRPITPIQRALAAARDAGLRVLRTRQGYRADLADLSDRARARTVKRRHGNWTG